MSGQPFLKKIFSRHAFTCDHDKNTGMALSLLSLLLWFHFRHTACIAFGVFFLLIAMVWPLILRPAAILWYGFSHLLGQVMSRIILTIIYVGLVVPVSFIRKIMGRDDLKLREFKQDTCSVFSLRDHLVQPEDLRQPY